MLSPEDARLVDHLHGGFPLSDRPFAEVGAALGWNEDRVIERLHLLLARGDLTRFGPLFQIERAGGQFVLAALRVPNERFDAVAALVNAQPEVAHNYRRNHALNQWFVVATASPEQAREVLDRIEGLVGLPVLAFPKEREYFVELRLPIVSTQGPDPAAAAPRRAPRLDGTRTRGALDDFERELIAATQGGLPLLSRPYEAVGAMLGVSGEQVRQHLGRLLDEGLIRRIGAVPNHYRLGFTANGMSVWDVDDDRVDELGARVGALPGVSHCYRRPRHRPDWPYNLFAMLHGRSEPEVAAQARQIESLLGVACHGHDILYSTAILKKTGLRLQGH